MFTRYLGSVTVGSVAVKFNGLIEVSDYTSALSWGTQLRKLPSLTMPRTGHYPQNTRNITSRSPDFLPSLFLDRFFLRSDLACIYYIDPLDLFSWTKYIIIVNLRRTGDIFQSIVVFDFFYLSYRYIQRGPSSDCASLCIFQDLPR